MRKEFTEEEIKEACGGLTDEQAGRLRYMLNRQLDQERSYRRLTAIADVAIVIFALLGFATMVAVVVLKAGGIL